MANRPTVRVTLRSLAGGSILFAALMALIAAAVLGLSHVMAAWLATLLVGIAASTIPTFAEESLLEEATHAARDEVDRTLEAIEDRHMQITLRKRNHKKPRSRSSSSNTQSNFAWVRPGEPLMLRSTQTTSSKFRLLSPIQPPVANPG